MDLLIKTITVGASLCGLILFTAFAIASVEAVWAKSRNRIPEPEPPGPPQENPYTTLAAWFCCDTINRGLESRSLGGLGAFEDACVSLEIYLNVRRGIDTGAAICEHEQLGNRPIRLEDLRNGSH